MFELAVRESQHRYHSGGEHTEPRDHPHSLQQGHHQLLELGHTVDRRVHHRRNALQVARRLPYTKGPWTPQATTPPRFRFTSSKCIPLTLRDVQASPFQSASVESSIYRPVTSSGESVPTNSRDASVLRMPSTSQALHHQERYTE